MPKVRMFSIYQQRDGSFAHPGNVISVALDEAERLIAGRYAQLVEGEAPVRRAPAAEPISAPVETAAAAPEEDAAERTGRARPRSRG